MKIFYLLIYLNKILSCVQHDNLHKTDRNTETNDCQIYGDEKGKKIALYKIFPLKVPN